MRTSFLCRVISILGVSLFIVFMSCNNKTKEYPPLDLLSHGLPIKIKAPEDVEIKFQDFGILKEMTVENAENYALLISASETSSLDIKKVLGEQKEIVEASPYFSKIMEEEEDGFIFEKKIDDDYINYDFRHVRLRGENKYIFRAGLSRQYTLDEIKEIYQSVK
jgi:hypothetical protein